MNKDKEFAVEVENITVKLNSNFTLGTLSFKIPKKSVVGVIGANGSGKTILISTIVGLIIPTTGFVKIHSKSYGVALQTPSFYPNKTVLQNLSIFSAPKNILKSEIEQLLYDIDIANYKDSYFKNLSTGTQKRMEIINALLGSPDLVILDEPTANVDEIGIRLIRKKLFNLIENEKTIIITNHKSFELEEICSFYLLLQNGKILDFIEKNKFISKYKSVKNAIKRIRDEK